MNGAPDPTGSLARALPYPAAVQADPAWAGATSSETGLSAAPVGPLTTSVRRPRLRDRAFCVWSLAIRMLRMLAGQDRAGFTRIGRCDGGPSIRSPGPGSGAGLDAGEGAGAGALGRRQPQVREVRAVDDHRPEHPHLRVAPIAFSLAFSFRRFCCRRRSARTSRGCRSRRCTATRTDTPASSAAAAIALRPSATTPAHRANWFLTNTPRPTTQLERRRCTAQPSPTWWMGARVTVRASARFRPTSWSSTPTRLPTRPGCGLPCARTRLAPPVGSRRDSDAHSSACATATKAVSAGYTGLIGRRSRARSAG